MRYDSFVKLRDELDALKKQAAKITLLCELNHLCDENAHSLTSEAAFAIWREVLKYKTCGSNDERYGRIAVLAETADCWYLPSYTAYGHFSTPVDLETWHELFVDWQYGPG